MELHVSDYEILEEIGSGSFGKVMKVRHKTKGALYAWKEVFYGTMDEKEKTMLVNEVNLLRELRHPNIIRYYDRIIDKSCSKIYIIMELCDGGDLGMLIKKCKDAGKRVDEEVVWKILAQMCLALHECHKHTPKILHRDIKPRNIFLNSHKIAKLGDFGLARTLDDHSFARTCLGTPFYQSPEQIKDEPYDERSDVWSLGCVIYELCTLTPPFNATSLPQLNQKICESPIAPLNPLHYSKELFAVISGMMEKSVQRRWTIERILAYPSVQLRVKEIKVSHQTTLLIRKEEELKMREERIRQKEEYLKKREEELSIWEETLKMKEDSMRRRDTIFMSEEKSHQEKDLDDNEDEIKQEEKRQRKVPAIDIFIQLLYAYGDVQKPLPETAYTLMEYVFDYIRDEARKLRVLEDARQEQIKEEDILYLAKKDKKKYLRCLELLEMNQLVGRVARQRSGKEKDVIKQSGVNE
ncbi:putative protein serine/threonine kinase [Monocercomonoides exilis]|uniref:putative protein serine/threonine kinase n=1 Tax=Monocercomonoides exilis TaxID=2049356 RepID=UPI0035593D81|nr:putative protein serine/threonine kinase [Monocercomonoides exilis]|eukprot:MONOS_2751.1-p1 / transcript=MONOS_2751.1 / gene=MONOS_2751 / organism=Monocercomonoides_exilis_PA203 / gene_product=Protein kinase domain containing protein / transcript_product=Protein kinase domain containing protein / location=Mono_scaffold00058:120583-122915(-) / protein_length=466 / sequence_SO=supercontig / SO=protein_coding / is_pseudo=false